MMKAAKFVLALMLLSAATGCIEDDAKAPDAAAPAPENEHNKEVIAAMADSSSFTEIKWIDKVKEMGTIKEGDKLEVTFRFVNVGSKPLVIQSAVPSCGCTVPEKPEKPVMPGEEGVIKAVFDSNGRPGANHKTINVIANTKPSTDHPLEFNVNVLASDKAPAGNGGAPAANPGFQ